MNDRSSSVSVLEYQSGGMVDWFRWLRETLKYREEMKPAGKMEGGGTGEVGCEGGCEGW